ncbi:MAG: hypothetical protein ACREMK_13895 [Gemmatimonadota bacterium]
MRIKYILRWPPYWVGLAWWALRSRMFLLGMRLCDSREAYGLRVTIWKAVEKRQLAFLRKLSINDEGVDWAVTWAERTEHGSGEFF